MVDAGNCKLNLQSFISHEPEKGNALANEDVPVVFAVSFFVSI